MPNLSSTGLIQTLRQGSDICSPLAISGGQLNHKSSLILSPTDLANSALTFGLTIEFSFDSPSPLTWVTKTSETLRCGVLDKNSNPVVPAAGINLNPGDPIPTFIRSTLSTPQSTSVGVQLSAA